MFININTCHPDHTSEPYQLADVRVPCKPTYRLHTVACTFTVHPAYLALPFPLYCLSLGPCQNPEPNCPDTLGILPLIEGTNPISTQLLADPTPTPHSCLNTSTTESTAFLDPNLKGIISSPSSPVATRTCNLLALFLLFSQTLNKMVLSLKEREGERQTEWTGFTYGWM